MKRNDSVEHLGRVVAAAAASACAALALAVPASAKPIVTTHYVEVANCVGHSQFCPVNIADAPSFTVNNGLFPMVVEFTANQNHCSDMIAHIIVDGNEWGSNVVHPGQSDGGYEIPAKSGKHTIGVQAEGVSGGCNTGYVAAWGGTVTVTVQGTLN
ncbi:MAG: hypothetical protein QOE04_2260 [Mycobacterium sp.]|jgi:hypothetical protein|nr:hypothetical protein [Mycobacterium sp.]MDT5388619.1 hypothetical protein [Mycobacterium sp.]MDT5397932.1 hypothetical protein [Mycobacterium sp.]